MVQGMLSVKNGDRLLFSVTGRMTFQKAESDLDYIQTTLDFEMMKRLPNGLAEEENPLVLVKQLSIMKSRYKSLCEELENISAERRESMRVIRPTLAKTVKLVQEVQQHTGTEISSLSEEEQRACST
ncbi:spindle and kinetochore-associated protein 2 isoform 2-T2 [Vipera latastei]